MTITRPRRRPRPRALDAELRTQRIEALRRRQQDQVETDLHVLRIFI